MNHLSSLSGVFAPVVTPFQNDGLAFDALRANLRRYNETTLTGYLALGSNGEFRSLTDAEQWQVLEVFAEEKGDKVVMVGVACDSTKETIEKCKRIAEMGFPYVSILTPSYFAKQMNDDTLERYFTAVADASPVPLLMYNAPGFTGVTISAKLVSSLAKHPNILGVKDSSSVGPNGYLSKLEGVESFYVLAGSANFFYTSLHAGAVGGIISLANALPEATCQLYDLFKEKRFEEASTLHQRISRLNSAASGAGGVAGVKAAMDLCGYQGLEPRHPLVVISDEKRATLEKALRDEGY